MCSKCWSHLDGICLILFLNVSLCIYNRKGHTVVRGFQNSLPFTASVTAQRWKLSLHASETEDREGEAPMLGLRLVNTRVLLPLVHPGLISLSQPELTPALASRPLRTFSPSQTAEPSRHQGSWAEGPGEPSNVSRRPGTREPVSHPKPHQTAFLPTPPSPRRT